MSSPIIFNSSDYIGYLQEWIQAAPDRWGLLTKMADAIGCQRPHLSRVLTGATHLTPAQGFALTLYWKMTEDESEFFLALLERARAATKEYRQYWDSKLTQIKRRQETLSHRVQRTEAKSDLVDATYYSAWYWTAAHILTSIPGFQTDQKISERLGLGLEFTREILGTLESWGAVTRQGTNWKFAAREQHIGRGSPLAVFHHGNWRQRAVADAQSPQTNGVHFTVVQSVSREDVGRLKEEVLRSIQSFAKIAGPSNEEELVCFNCDFFVV